MLIRFLEGQIHMSNKSLAKNSIYNVVYKLLNVFFPLIYATYVSHVLLADGVGKVATVQNAVQYFTIVAALGIPNYGIREIAKKRFNKVEKNRVFSELFAINALSTSLCIIVYYTMIFTVSYFSSERLLYLIIGINIILNYFNIDWFYQGEEEYSYMAKRSFFIKVLSLIAIFIFVKDVNDYIIYGFIFAISLAGNYFFNIINLRKYSIRFEIKGLNIKRHVKPVFILLGTAIAIELYTLLDVTMLGFLCTSNIVGYYSNTMRVVKVLITVITAIGGVLLPRLSYYAENNDLVHCNKIVNKVFLIMLYLFLPCGIGLILVADPLVIILFGYSFEEAITTMRICSLLVYALGYSNLFGTQVLLTFGEEKKLMLCTMIGAISNITLNFLWIPSYQQNGAAVASVISESIVTLLTYIYASKYIKIKVRYNFIISSIISLIGMIIFVMCIKLFIDNYILQLVLSMIVGTATYILCGVITKNEILNELISLLKDKLKKI